MYFHSMLSGDLVYNVTDGLGWCYVAYCNTSCKVDSQSSACPSPPVPTSTSATKPFTTASTSPYIQSTTRSAITQDCINPTKKVYMKCKM